MPTLYYSRNPNPRLAVAVARYLNAPVTLKWAAPFAPDQAERFLKLNPTQRIPILVEADGNPLWEADAIACHLSQMVGSDFWRQGSAQPDMIRWLSWGKENFVRACDMVQFELGTKRRYGIGPCDAAAVAVGTALFHVSAAILDRHLETRDWLTGATPSHADFRMASFLPFNLVMRLPLHDYPAVAAWYARLEAIPAWSDPFAGLDAPELPPIPA
ncbi:glutathione S-transferase family protein [Tabrizicola sp.]|uniref:glutathione S-transferase family protein n=1 Tax=Tabrizicola sp. TaxID=2005166 RepID=UPI0027359319|nr:glutathione S-transferase family protein [Tabrizicola sp.]MDP3197747.1 glutathione S-transferase family protein [Tabrizicola sp.]